MKAVDEAFKSGVNFFDVAPFYASGDAERVRRVLVPSIIVRQALQNGTKWQKRALLVAKPEVSTKCLYCFAAIGQSNQAPA